MKTEKQPDYQIEGQTFRLIGNRNISFGCVEDISHVERPLVQHMPRVPFVVVMKKGSRLASKPYPVAEIDRIIEKFMADLHSSKHHAVVEWVDKDDSANRKTKPCATDS